MKLGPASCSLLALEASAADLDAAIRAFDNGDFERAYAELVPLVNAGSA